MVEPSVAKTRADLLALLDRIDMLLGEVREKVIDDDPEMHEKLREARHGDA